MSHSDSTHVGGTSALAPPGVCRGLARRARGLGALPLWLGLVAGAAVALAGCGSGQASRAPRTAQIAFGSPSMTVPARGGVVIPARYTCDGANKPPPLRWGVVPPSTTSMAIFLFKLGRSTPTGNGSFRVEIQLEWAVGGLPPAAHAFAAGRLPHGSFASRKGYSICPAKGKSGTYLFQINALSRRPAFTSDPNQLLQDAEGTTVASSTFSSLYKRA